MKNQYYGDNKDLFKYDIIEQIMTRVKNLKKFSFIPMLTPNDNRNDGNDRERENARAGYKNKDLMEFLERARELDRDQRDFRKIRGYFEKIGVNIKIYNHDRKDEFFMHKGRSEYFKNVPGQLLGEALVFIDPDNGLEVKRNRKKHLLYEEAKSLIQDSSTLMIIQFFPREELDKYIKRRKEELSNRVGRYVVYIADSKIIFFFISDNKNLIDQIQAVLRDYCKEYSKTYFDN